MILDQNLKPLYSVWIPFDALILLDGKVDEKTQKVIDEAKTSNAIGLPLPFMNDIIASSIKMGKLTWRFKEISNCPYCGKNRRYATYKRTTYSMGIVNHRKGEEDRSKPHYYMGVAFNEGFITFHGSGDCCQECFDRHNVMKTLIDYVLDHDLKIEIQKNDYKKTRYIKDDIRICFACKKEIPKSKMGMLPALMGGEYHGECPECGAKSVPFGQTHEVTNKFVMIPLTLDGK